MKQLVLAIALLLALATPSFSATAPTVQATATQPAFGWERSIKVEWGYTPPSDPAVTAFQLYQDGTKVCRWDGGDLRVGNCEVTLVKKTTPFTLTALFSDGTESGHSNVFSLTDILPTPSIKSMSITVEFVQ